MFSLRTRQAVSILTYLSSLDTDIYLSSNELADTLQIKRPTVRKVVENLSNRGFVKTRQGFNGGVRMSPQQRKVKVLEMLEDWEDLSVDCFVDSLVPEVFRECFLCDWFARIKHEVFGDVTFLDLGQTYVQEAP